MSVTTIGLDSVEGFSKLFLDYINQDKKTSSFYPYPPTIHSVESCIQAVSQQRYNRSLLAQVLMDQYAHATIAPPETIQLLLKENTFTVCTGHQIGLFTGPLYFIYKLISTLNLAQALKQKYPNYHFVPLYWMASEDHDFEEINHIHLFGKKPEWKNKQGGSVGNYSTKGIEDVINELKPLIGESENAKQLIRLFQDSYLNHSSLAQATRYLVHTLFKDSNLLILDANDARLKAAFTAVMKDDLLHHSSFHLINQTISELEKLEYKTPVHPREINLFYASNHSRERIVFEKGTYSVLNTALSFNETELLEELQHHPERFSPNVVLRPLYQQRLLPNVAYVGGPGEIAYWLEYNSSFNHYQIPFPVLIPRNFVTVLDESLTAKMKKLNLSHEDLFLPIPLLTKKYIHSFSENTFSLDEEREHVTQLYHSLTEKIKRIDSSLAASAEAEKQNQLKGIDHLEKKVMRSLKIKNETAITQIEKIKNKLFPHNTLQERHDNFIPYYLLYGKDFFNMLQNNLHPFEYKMILLEYGRA